MAFNKFPISGYPSGADEATPGSLVDAENMIISRPGVISRRGAYTKFISQFGSIVGGVPNLPVQGVGQYGAGGLGFIWETLNNSGVVTGVRVGSTSKSLSLPIGSAERVGSQFLRGVDDILSGAEFPYNGGVFFPTLPAIAVANNSTNIWNAGCPRCQDITWVGDKIVNATGSATVTPSLGFSPGDTVAYRATLAYDRTGVSGSPVTVTGPPSGRFIYARQTSATGITVPTLQIRIPVDFVDYYTTNNATPFIAYIYVYRSILTAAASLALTGIISPAPTDEMQLVFKTIIQAADITNGYIQFTDVCPSGGEGPALYSNPSLGGSNVERWLPPTSNSVAAYKGTCFYGGVQDRVARTSMIITGTPFIMGNSFTVTSTSISVVIGTLGTLPQITVGQIFSLYKATGGGGISGDYTVNGTATLSGGLLTVPISSPPAAGAYNGYYGAIGRVIVTLQDTTNTSWAIEASFNAATTGTAHKFLLEAPFNASTFILETSTKSYVQKFAAAICTGINVTAIKSGYVITASNLSTGTLESAVITLEVELTTNNPAIDNTSIFALISANGSPTNYYDLAARVVPTTRAQFTSNINRVAWGAPGIYDHISPGYYFDIGSPQREILKIIATRNALYVFKEDGLWVIDGDGSGGSNWTLTFITTDVIPLAPSSIDVYEDSVYAACYTGVVEINGATVNLISQPLGAEYTDIIKAKNISAIKNQIGACCYTCIASYFDQALTISIPVATTLSDGGWYDAAAILVYSFVTQQWLVGYEYGVNLFTSDSNVGTQYAAPIHARPAFRVQSNNVLDNGSGSPITYDTVQKAIVRFAGSQRYSGIFISAHAIETGNVASGAPLGPYQFTAATAVLRGSSGRLLPYTDDSQKITLTYTGTQGQYYFDGPLIQPEADLTNAGLLLISTTSDTIIPILTYAYTSTSAPAMRTTITIKEASAGSLDATAVWLLMPPQVNMVFSPIGDGSQAYNFQQTGIMQTRRSSAKNLDFTFWLDTVSPFPTQPKQIVTVSPYVAETVPKNVIRSGIPQTMTRGSRLNIQVQAGASAGERIEFSQLLLDFVPIAGEEIVY